MAITDRVPDGLTDVRTKVDNTDILAGIKIIDADTHLSEPYDLWTSRAPAKYRDLVPQIREVNGRRKWVVNGDIPLAGDSAVSATVTYRDQAGVVASTDSVASLPPNGSVSIHRAPR